MAISKVVYSGQTLIDLTGDTVSAETLAKNATAHDKAGNLIVGQLEPVETATYYTGSTEPASSLGVNGDLYCVLRSGDA